MIASLHDSRMFRAVNSERKCSVTTDSQPQTSGMQAFSCHFLVFWCIWLRSLTGGEIKSYKLYLIISCNRFYEFIQLNVFYNVENQTLLQSPQQASDEEAFSLNIRLSENSNHSNMILSVCTR